jgi:hypothetical protein
MDHEDGGDGPANVEVAPAQRAHVGGRGPLPVFSRTGTDEANVAYRKPDGSVAWIDRAR